MTRVEKNAISCGSGLNSLGKKLCFPGNYFFPLFFLVVFQTCFASSFFPNYRDSLISREKNVNPKETPSGSMVTLATAPYMLPSSTFYRTESTKVTTKDRKVDKLMVKPSKDRSISKCLTPWKENTGKTEIKLPPKNQPKKKNTQKNRNNYPESECSTFAICFLSFFLPILKPVCLDGTVAHHHHLSNTPVLT